MKKIRWISLSVLLMIGTVTGLYLHQQSAFTTTLTVSDQAVRNMNEVLIKMIKKDPRTWITINGIIAKSPYLKDQKKAFLNKYYDHKSTADINRTERLLRLYTVSQQPQITKK